VGPPETRPPWLPPLPPPGCDVPDAVAVNMVTLQRTYSMPSWQPPPFPFPRVDPPSRFPEPIRPPTPMPLDIPDAAAVNLTTGEITKFGPPEPPPFPPDPNKHFRDNADAIAKELWALHPINPPRSWGWPPDALPYPVPPPLPGTTVVPRDPEPYDPVDDFGASIPFINAPTGHHPHDPHTHSEGHGDPAPNRAVPTGR
jgi:hypothetical protein